MVDENDPELTKVINMLEAEPASSPAAVPGPDIPSLREQLAILVSTGKCKETISVNMTHDQVKRLEDKDVIRHYKRYETYVGAKTTETLMESFLLLSTKSLANGMVVRLKEVGALQNELKSDYIFTKELSSLSGLLAVANAFLITAKHVDFSANEETHHHRSRDADSYPLAGVDEVDNAKQSQVIDE